MLVREVMTTDIVTVSIEATLADAVERLLANEIGSVVVLADGNPTGIVTETDALDAAHETGKPLAGIGLRRFCEGPVATTAPDRTVQDVARRMADEGVKKFPVMADLDLVGMVTLTDIVYQLSDIRSEAQALADRHYDWSA
jgi:CBS domain-containing protein